MRPDEINPLMTPMQDFLLGIASDQDVRDLAERISQLEAWVGEHNASHATGALPGMLVTLEHQGESLDRDNLTSLWAWSDKKRWTLGGDEDAVRRQSMVLDHIHTLVTRALAGGVVELPKDTEVVR